MPSAQRDGLTLADDEIRRDSQETQQISRDDEMLTGLLVIFAKPLAEKGELALRAAALAHDHRAAMQRGAELRHDGERALINGGKAGHRAVDRSETLQAPRIARAVRIDRPGHDHLVADIGMHRPTMRRDRRLDVKEEACDQVVHLELAHGFGEQRRIGEIEEHNDQLLALRAMIGAERDVG